MIDILIVILLVLFVARSLRGGLNGELYGTMGWLAAILISLTMTETLESILAESFPQLEAISPYLSFILILIFIRALTVWVVKLVEGLEKGPAAVITRVVSSVLGFFKGMFFISVFLLIVTRTTIQANIESYTESSILYPFVKPFSIQVVHTVTEHVPNVETILQNLSERRTQGA